MISYVPKAEFFTAASWCALLLAVALAQFIRPFCLRVCRRGTFLYALLLVATTYVFVGGALGLTTRGVVGATAALAVLGTAGRVWKGAPSGDAVSPARTAPLLTALALAVIAVVAGTQLFDHTVWIHYDYFHGTIPSIDLGLHGRSPSAWLSAFDPTHWFVTVQGLLPVLDAYEVFLNGTISTTLAELLLVALMVMVILDCPAGPGQRPGGRADRVVLALVLAVFLFDFHMSPRPHILLGMSLLAFVLRSQAGASARELWLYLALAVLAKRDGVLIVGFLVAGGGVVLMVRRLGWVAAAIGGAASAIALAVALNSWVAIHSMSPLQLLVDTVIHPRGLAALGQPDMLVAVAATAAVAAAAWAARVATPVMAIVLIVGLYVVGSGAALEFLGQYNVGTVLRKVFYFLIPVLCGALIAARNAPTSRVAHDAVVQPS